MNETIKLNCLARGVKELEYSDGWIWGVAVGTPEPGLGTLSDLKKYLDHISASRFQFPLPAETLGAFSELKCDTESVREFILQYGILRETNFAERTDLPRHIKSF